MFERSIAGLRKLNALGYGVAGSGLKLDLVYNPGGAFLPPPQEMLRAKYTEELQSSFGIVFNELFTMTNMPIKRFADLLYKQGQLEAYMALLVDSVSHTRPPARPARATIFLNARRANRCRTQFNPATIDNMMCRSLVSVAHDGSLYDCDFNLALALPLQAGAARSAKSIFDIDSLDELAGAKVHSGNHCFGCAAGSGSS